MKDQILKWITDNEGAIKSTYHYLHANAEISWQEKKTTEYICAQLEELGVHYETFGDHTGVVGLGSGLTPGLHHPNMSF